MSKVFTELTDADLIKSIKGGAIGVLPTDTIYGLVAKADDKQAVARLYDLKKREKKPGTVIAANIAQLEKLGIKHRYLKAVEHFWPNPISVLIPYGAELDYLKLGLDSIAVRIPKDKELLNMLSKTGPLLTSSANHPSEKPANTIMEAELYFANNVDFYVDGGDLSKRQPSTIIRIIDDAIEVVREGAVKIDESGKITK